MRYQSLCVILIKTKWQIWQLLVGAFKQLKTRYFPQELVETKEGERVRSALFASCRLFLSVSDTDVASCCPPGLISYSYKSIVLTPQSVHLCWQSSWHQSRKMLLIYACCIICIFKKGLEKPFLFYRNISALFSTTSDFYGHQMCLSFGDNLGHSCFPLTFRPSPSPAQTMNVWCFCSTKRKIHTNLEYRMT